MTITQSSLVTKIRSDNQADIAHLQQLINSAKSALDGQAVTSALIYFSPHYLRLLDQALPLTCNQLASLNVFGAVVDGVCTGEDWQFDRPAMALMLFAEETIWQTSNEVNPRLANSFALQYTYNNQQSLNICGVTSDFSFAFGRKKQNNSGQIAFSGKKVSQYLIQPWQTIGAAIVVNINATDEYIRFNQQTLASCYARQCEQANITAVEWHKVALLKILNKQNNNTQHKQNIQVAINAQQIEQTLNSGQYQELLLLDEEKLTNQLSDGDVVIFATRSSTLAVQRIKQVITQIKQNNWSRHFCLLHSSNSMAGEFYGYRDEFLHALSNKISDLPILGAYARAVHFSTNNTNQELHHAALATIVKY